MAKTAKQGSNPARIRLGIKLGELDAEADRELLKDCFLDTGLLKPLMDVSSPASIVLGRTGSGKSALLIHIDENAENSVLLDPNDISIRFLEYSNIIQFLSELGVNLDIFYRVLWRHILTVELLKLRYEVKNESQGRGLIEKMTGLFSKDRTKEKAFSYFTEWGDKFWLETDEQLKELTEKFERDVRSKFGADMPKMQVSLEGAKSLSVHERKEVSSRASRVVSQMQIKRLDEVLRLLEEHAFDDRQKRYYILIDGLDENWAETDTRYRFIKALIEELKSFRKMKQVKILPAIRRDLLDTVFDRTRDSGFQEEKYDSYIVHVRWTKENLKAMLERRVNEVYRRQYTKENVKLTDVLSRRKGGQAPEEYLIERTLFRPRDALQYANECFNAATSETKVSIRALHTAEAIYSSKRAKSLCEEWYDFYPCLKICLELLRKLPSPFSRTSLDESRVDKLVMDLYSCERNDPVIKAARDYFEGNTSSATQEDVVTAAFQALYHVGAIGLKLSTIDTHVWSFIDQPRINRSEAERATQILVHKMLHRSLEITSKSKGQGEA